MKSATLVQVAFIFLAGLAVFAFVTMAKDAESRRACVPVCLMRPNYAGQNRLAPDFELTDGEGRKVHLSDYRGKTVVLNFWTTTCQPCLEEMPSLAELANILKARKNVALLTVSTDTSREVALSALKTLLHEEKPPFPVLLDPELEVVRDKYGTHLFPETWIIDPKGVIRARFDSARDWSQAMVLDLIESIERPTSCGIEIQAGVPSGPETAYCDESGATG